MKKYLSKTIKEIQMLPFIKFKYGKRFKESKIRLLGSDFKIADGTSFYYSYREIFLDQIYKFNSKKISPTIIDCGSNYGTSILYFKNLFPQSKIVGVEADPNIFKLLSWNIDHRNYDNVLLINKAISSNIGPVKFWLEGADGGRINNINVEKVSVEVSSISLDDLIDGPIDFLKVDIEGAETEVICSSKKLSQVSQIFIEYHSFSDSPQRLNELLSIMTEKGFRYYIHTQFCSPKPLIEERTQLGMDLQLNIFAKKKE